MKLHFKLSSDLELIPQGQVTLDYMSKRKEGEVLSAEVKKVRNYEFHKKIMALFSTVNENLPDQNPIEHNGQMVEIANNFETTRKYLVIMSGYSNLVLYPNGKLRVEAKSLSFENMESDEFEKLYSAVIDSALKLMSDKWTGDDLERVSKEIMRFA